MPGSTGHIPDRALPTHSARQAYEALGCAGYGRVDLLLDCHGPTLLEMNTFME